MKSGKWHIMDRMELPNQAKIRTLGEKETYKYLGILEAATIKQEEMKEKIKKEYFGRTRNLYPRDDVDSLYVSRKEGGRGFASIGDIIDTSIQRLRDYIEKHGGRLITATRNNTDNMRSNRTTITRKQKWEEKQPYGHFKQLISNISHEKPWT